MYITLKCIFKLYDRALEPAVKKAAEARIAKAVEAQSGMSLKKKDDQNVVLTVTVALDADDKKAPKQLKATITIEGVLLGRSAALLNATGHGKMDGLNPKKIDGDAAFVGDSAVADLMKDKVIPALLKLGT